MLRTIIAFCLLSLSVWAGLPDYSKMYVGDTPLAKAYIGETQIWTAYVAPVIPDGVIAWYKMDDHANNSTVTDTVGSTGNGVWTDGVYNYTSDNSVTDTRFGQVLIFDGLVDYVSVANAPILDADTPFSVSFWVKTSPAYEILIGNQDTSHTQTGWSIFSVYGGMYLQLNGGTYFGESELQSYAGGSFNIADGNWNFVVVTYDGTATGAGVGIYLNADGNNYHNGNDSDNLTTSIITAAPVTIGASPSLSYYANGSMYDIRIYNRELTVEEISALYATY